MKCITCKISISGDKPIHPFIRKAYDTATFECPQKCGKNDLTINSIMVHCNKVCEFRLVTCPFENCGQIFNRFTINRHKSKCPAGMPKKCLKCDGELKEEHDCI